MQDTGILMEKFTIKVRDKGIVVIGEKGEGEHQH